jgi:hypothetical protein
MTVTGKKLRMQLQERMVKSRLMSHTYTNRIKLIGWRRFHMDLAMVSEAWRVNSACQPLTTPVVPQLLAPAIVEAARKE